MYKRRREVGGLQGGADRIWTWIIKERTCIHKTSDLANKTEGEGRIFVLINVRRSTGNPCKRENE